MSSSMLAGERKWATARKGGMTVLGKVTVPKPLNLPSQRSENHGMNPNVAIVPKGTLSWGSRGSSYSDAKNSAVSSNADGGVVSPRHRPSSGGGTRPSTAGSDRNHEPSSAWGSNSRPSSAAGTYPSNQSTLSSRPRSAETRPNSSQLSRFAEPVVNNSSSWGPDITSERLGVKQDGFSLHSGDFPTLGAERVDSLKNIEYEDHSRPTSASGTSVQPEKDPKSDTDVQRGSFGAWRMEESQVADDSIHPNMEKWHVDPTHYHHANVPPQYFDAWYGPPMNVPDALWDRGHPRAPQFRPPVGPNGFPMEPLPYYRPRMPPPHLAGSLPVPPPGAAPRGPHPKNGDLYRPHVHDAYARPNMSYRPGFYHGPRGSMPFEGHYGPHMAYRNAEHDIPYMGEGAGHHPAYNGYPRPGAPNLGNSRGRAGGYSPSGNTVTDADHLEDSLRGKRVPPSHERWNQKMVGENWEDKPGPVMLYPRKDHFPPMGINEMGVAEHTKEDAFDNRGAPGGNLEGIAEHRSHTAENTKPNSFKVLGKVKAVKDSGSNETEKVACFPTEMSQVHHAGVTGSSVPAATRDPALLQKIEGLNAKIRVSDVRDDESPIMDNIKEQRIRSQLEDQKIDDDCIGEVSINASEFLNKAPIFGDAPVSQESVQPAGAVPRRLGRDGHCGDSYRGKGKFNSQGTDGWRRKGLHAGSSGPSTTSNTDSVTANNPSGHDVIAKVFENPPIDKKSKNEGDITDSHDDSAMSQRVKMSELAKRALQWQKEEEVRAREQKAKAFAKLDELNRRTLAAGESGLHKPGDALAVTQNQEEQSVSETIGDKFSESGTNIEYHSDVTHVERNTNQPAEFVEDSRNPSLGMLKTDLSVSEALHLPACKDSVDRSARVVDLQTDDNRGISTLKPARHDLNQKISPGTSLNDRYASKDHILIGAIVITLPEGPLGETRVEERAPNTSNAPVQPAEPQRKKSNHSKNRRKLNVASTRTMSPIKNEMYLSGKIESGSSPSNFDSSVQMEVPIREISSPPGKDSLNRVTNQWRNQPPRKLARGQQANRSSDKLHGNDNVVWAPVRTHTNKAEDSFVADRVSSEESMNRTRVDIKSENILGGKRADIERYVTKAAVKELSQQETIPASSLNEGSVKEQPSLPVKSKNPHSTAVLVAETMESDGGRYSKHKKEHEVSKPRITADASSHTDGGGHLMGPNKDGELSKGQNESREGENLVANLKNSEGAHTSSGVTTALSSKYPHGKDQGMGRGKRQLPRGSRSVGYNSRPENIPAVDIEGALDVNRTERTISSKEIQKSAEHSHSHWKPKSNSASRTSGSVAVAAEVNHQLAEKDPLEAKASEVSKHDKEIDKMTQLPQVETVQSKAGDRSTDPSHREFNKEKKPLAQSKSTPFTPNHDSTGPGDTTEDQLAPDGSSGYNRHRSQNNRSFKGHEFRAHNPPQVVRERQRQSTHYEYQPIDPSRSTRPRRAENPPPEGAEGLDRRYQDRGLSHPKRGGNYYRHQSGTTRVDSAGHD